MSMSFPEATFSSSGPPSTVTGAIPFASFMYVRHQETSSASTSPWSQFRCQRAKSEYWTGGGGSAGRTPAASAP